MNKKLLWSAVTYTAAVGAGMLTHQAARATYRKRTGDEPPENTARRDTGWREALLWGAMSGALVGAARVVGHRLGDEARQRADKRHAGRRSLGRFKD